MKYLDIKAFALGVASREDEPTGTINITDNGIYDVVDYATANVEVEGTTPDLVDLTAIDNGTYTHPDHDGYDTVVVNVPKGITPTGTKSITSNGITDVTNYANADVNVPNSYSASDEGKVVDNGALVSQTSRNINSNGTVDTTTNNEVVVAVPNTYTQSDEGKVVSSGALVAQTSTTKNANGIYDTTLNNSVTVAVPQPTGNINITDMNQTNVAAYATAQVVDADLVAGNIKKDVNILGITGTFEGGITPTGTLNITENGDYDVTDKAQAHVAVPDVPADIDALSVNANGTYTASECDGFSPVTVNVPIPTPDLEDITITANGTYESTQHDGYGEVTVNVSGGTPDIGCIVTRDEQNKTVTYDIYGYGKSGNIPAEKIPPISLYFWDDYIGNGLTWHVYVNLHSNEIEVIPDNWMYGVTSNGWKVPHVTLPDSVKRINTNAFSNCQFSSFELPSSLEYIGALAFNECDGLQMLEFKSTPTTIHSLAFNGCSNLYDIYVPWSEGTVANAPWGAPSSCNIHYNWSE